MSNIVMFRYLQIKNWIEREEGQDLIEYALIAVLVSLAVVGGLTALAGGLNSVWSRIVSQLAAS
ncbi:MAG: Flp family type IVb pilin [Caldilineaceae bacterium]